MGVDAVEPAAEHRADGSANQLAPHGVGPAQLAFVLQLELAGHRRKGRVDVGDAGRRRFPGRDGAALRVRDHVLQAGDRHSLTDSRAAVDLLVDPRLEGDLLDHFAHVEGDGDIGSGVARHPGFLLGDGDGLVAGSRIVGPDLRSDAVLERGDDLAPRRVVLGIRGERHHDVEPQADGVAADLDVAFLQDVEQADLDLAGQVGELVDGEDAAVGARHEPVVDGELVRQPAPRRSRLDRVDVADHVGDRDVRGRELLDVAQRAVEPGDGQVVAFFLDAGAARGADRRERIVVDVAAGHDRDRLVEQLGEPPQQPRLGLPAQPQHDEVVPRQDGVDHLRDDRVVVADDAGKEGLVTAQTGHEVVAQLALDAAAGNPALADRATQASQGGGPHQSILPESFRITFRSAARGIAARPRRRYNAGGP